MVILKSHPFRRMAFVLIRGNEELCFCVYPGYLRKVALKINNSLRFLLYLNNPVHITAVAAAHIYSALRGNTDIA